MIKLTVHLVSGKNLVWLAAWHITTVIKFGENTKVIMNGGDHWMVKEDPEFITTQVLKMMRTLKGDLI